MSTLYWSLREAASWLKKHVALARISHSATTWCSFLSWQKRKQRKYQRIMGNSSNFTRCFHSNVRITTRVVLTKFDKKGYLHKTHFHKQCLSLIGGIKEFKIMVAEFVSAVSSNTHFSISDRCRWKRWATNIIAYSFEYNNKNTFLSPYNALALKIYLSCTNLDAYCYC